MIIYNLCIYIIAGFTEVAALFNPKINSFVKGRKSLLDELQIAFKGATDPVMWIHCASLGEFEQGRPVIEQFKKDFPDYKILLTFFSPSGYEVRKNYPETDFVFYLPWDTSRNAREFISIVNPKLAIFVKYEFWFNYFRELQKHLIPIISISTIFRQDQIYFKSHGTFFKSILHRVNHFFVQNSKSVELLKSINIQGVTLAGDTRFDRVGQLFTEEKEIPIAKAFKGTETLLVIGSCWPEDFEVLTPFINSQAGKLKFIIAPHEIESLFLQKIEKELQAKTIRYSQADQNLESYDVLIIDNIGLLSRIYHYGEYAYVGGAFGKGLHNILEAASNGIPIFFGNQNYQKFQEATDLIMRGGAFEIGGYSDLKGKFESLTNRPESYLLACEVTRSYVEENLGATNKIISYCHQLLDRQ